MATESSMETPSDLPTSSTDPSSKIAALRSRAFLGQLPDDFLNPSATNTNATDGHRRAGDPHLVPMTYAQAMPQYGRPPQENIIGKLKLTILQAKLAKNYGWTRMDPYCRVRVGHAVYETPTDVNGAKNPRWNKSFTTNLPRGINSLFIEIFNERYLALDDRIAWSHFEFPTELFSGETVEEWITLNGKQGDGQEGNINVILSFTSAPPPTAYQLTAYGAQPVSMVPVHGGYGYAAAAPTSPQGYYPQPAYPPHPGYAVQVQPQEQAQAHQIKEEDVKQLQEMFPTLEKDVIETVLQASGGRVDPAVSSLLQMTQ